MTPVLKKQGGGFLLGTLFSDALAGIDIKERNASEFMEKYGKRLSKMRSRMRQPTFKFRVACCLASTMYLDKIMKVLFEEAAREGGVQHEVFRRDDDDECKQGCEEDWLQDRTPSYRVQLCIYRQAAEVWTAMKGFYCATDTVSAYEVAALFWLAGNDVKQRDTSVVQDRATL